MYNPLFCVVTFLPEAWSTIFKYAWIDSDVAFPESIDVWIEKKTFWFLIPASTLNPTHLFEIAQSFLFVRSSINGLSEYLLKSKASLLNLELPFGNSRCSDGLSVKKQTIFGLEFA